MLTIMGLLGLAILGFGKSEPKVDTHDNEGIKHHMAYVMDADGTRSSTWVPCYCSAAQPGGNHDGAVPSTTRVEPDAK
jgi:hypothetical protein